MVLTKCVSGQKLGERRLSTKKVEEDVETKRKASVIKTEEKVCFLILSDCILNAPLCKNYGQFVDFAGFFSYIFASVFQ